jgi:tRNA nucleotidyltransferase/poly(A) polymerase
MTDFTVPTLVAQVAQKMIGAGHAAYLVGPGLRDLLTQGDRSHFELSTDAPIGDILKLFPSGVLIGRRRNTVMVPSHAGLVDVVPFRAGAGIESDLAHRDFTINAIAYDIAEEKWGDPHGGRADLENGLIRAVGRARDRFDADPIRALRGIRLAATRGWALDAEVETALESTRTALAKIPREPVRREIIAIILSAGVRRALDQLERSRITSQLAPGAIPGAGAWVARLPRELELRLAGWLRGANARTALQRLRFSPPTIDRVELLLRHLQTDRQVSKTNPAAITRFARRTGIQNLAAIIALREAEIETTGDSPAETGIELQKLRASLASLRDFERTASERSKLMITGANVMECLGCEPGPHVGRAIEYLTECIRLDPTLNSIDKLRDLLRNWTHNT